MSGATADIRYLRKNGDMQIIRVRVFPLKKNKDERLYYASLEDVTNLLRENG